MVVGLAGVGVGPPVGRVVFMSPGDLALQLRPPLSLYRRGISDDRCVVTSMYVCVDVIYSAVPWYVICATVQTVCGMGCLLKYGQHRIQLESDVVSLNFHLGSQTRSFFPTIAQRACGVSSPRTYVVNRIIRGFNNLSRACGTAFRVMRSA